MGTVSKDIFLICGHIVFIFVFKKLSKQPNQQFTAPAGNTYTFVQSQPYQMQQQYRQMPPQDSFLR